MWHENAFNPSLATIGEKVAAHETYAGL